MSLQYAIASLKNKTDSAICITEELHQIKQIEGYKCKSLLDMCNTFGKIGLIPILAFHQNHHAAWTIKLAGQLQTHLELNATIPLLLVPFDTNLEPARPTILSEEMSKEAGRILLGIQYELLLRRYPNDIFAICEFLGRLRGYYPEADTWRWHLCPKAGTTVNFYIEPTSSIDPTSFLRCQRQCSFARIQGINIYPYVIEIVFHAFSKIQRMPYNRHHQNRFSPY